MRKEIGLPWFQPMCVFRGEIKATFKMAENRLSTIASFFMLYLFKKSQLDSPFKK